MIYSTEMSLEKKTRTEQRTAVLVHLLGTGPLTQPAALELKIWRLAARCCELSKAGWDIQKRRLPGNFTEYSIDAARPRKDDEQLALPLEGGVR